MATWRAVASQNVTSNKNQSNDQMDDDWETDPDFVVSLSSIQILYFHYNFVFQFKFHSIL
jgi:hypothetical protein